MQKILVAGAGKIGTLTAALLAQTGDYLVTLLDCAFDNSNLNRLKAISSVNVTTMDICDTATMQAFCRNEKFVAVISCLPYFHNSAMAGVASECNMHYFDLTEDVATTNRVKDIAATSINNVFVPQCGLAPGFIGIAANSLAQKFSTVDTIKMRVGALPENVSNALNYYLTWSTDGLINEYANQCDAIENGQRVSLLPLQSLETIQIDGVMYEAFNTSGGLGSLVELYAGKVNAMNYKSVRYPGHCEKIRLLINDLRLKDDRGTLKHILENAIPKSYQDVVIIYISVIGERNEDLFEENVVRKIYPQHIVGSTWSAIQVTTASSVCAVVDIILNNINDYRGYVYQETISLDAFLANRFGQYYL